MSNETQMAASLAVLSLALCAIVRGVSMYSHALGWIVGGVLVGTIALCFAYQLVKEESRSRR